jgi:hypothetical protein
MRGLKARMPVTLRIYGGTRLSLAAHAGGARAGPVGRQDSHCSLECSRRGTGITKGTETRVRRETVGYRANTPVALPPCPEHSTFTQSWCLKTWAIYLFGRYF